MLEPIIVMREESVHYFSLNEIFSWTLNTMTNHNCQVFWNGQFVLKPNELLGR